MSRSVKLISRYSRVAEPFTLLKLPTHLVYHITERLDVRSQRNLFLSCAQLYQRWRLAIPRDECVWQLVHLGMQLLAEHAAKGAYDIVSGIAIHPVTYRGVTIRVKATVCCDPMNPRFLYCQSEPVMQNTRPRPRIVNQEEMWHRLSGKPSVASASMKIQSGKTADWTCLKDLAKQLYQLLQSNSGFLVFYSKHFGSLGDFGIERVAGRRGNRNCVLMVRRVASMWNIDNKDCIVSPPTINFDHMPTQITKICAHIWTSATPQQVWFDDFRDTDALSYFNPNCPLKTAFAYGGNVDRKLSNT